MKQTILVVDDHAHLRAMVADYLEEQGYRVLTASDGNEGLLVARRVRPDLVLIDVMMPGLDGLGFLQAYRREHNDPVILLTARVEETDKVVGLEMGADDYITKPFGMKELLAQRRDALVARLGAYYGTYGSWEGVGEVVSLTEAQPPPAQPHEPDGTYSPRVGFLLVDTGGAVVLAPDAGMLGQAVRAEELAAGTPVTVDEVNVGVLVTLGPPGGRNPAEARYLARTDLALGLAAVAAVGVALALGFVLARLITRPVRDLTEATRTLATGGLGAQVPMRSRDELGLLARQFNQMSGDLQRATELRRRMTADIAHDLRTPLTVISGYLEALRDESLRPTPARFAAMHDETEVLLHLVADLHTLSLVDAGELTLHPEPLAPRHLLDRTAATFQYVAAQSGVSLSIVAQPGLPALLGDPEQLLRVLSNLVSNALRYTPAGGQVTLGARGTPDAITLTVADTGAGIPAEDVPNVFERFYRADESRHQATGGSGLGLAIVRSIVEAHAGTVHSIVGQGTTFTITLPGAQVAAPSDASAEEVMLTPSAPRSNTPVSV